MSEAAPLTPSSESAVPGRAYEVVVVGASAGGIFALQDLLARLPADFPLPILVVQHVSATLPSKLPTVLGYRTALRSKWAEDGESVQPATVYVAPPDRHLIMVDRHRIGLSDAPRLGWWRPSVDLLFESAARVCGLRAIGVVLSGAMWDGVKGIAAVAEAGGITMAQDEATSHHFQMPAAALDIGRADVMMSPKKIARALDVLAQAVE